MKVCKCTDINCGCYISNNLTVGNVIPVTSNANLNMFSNIQSYSVKPTSTLTLKEQFVSDYESKNGKVKYIVVAVEMPNGSIEINTVSERIWEKYKFYVDMYNNNFEMMSNVMVKIVNYMIV